MEYMGWTVSLNVVYSYMTSYKFVPTCSHTRFATYQHFFMHTSLLIHMRKVPITGWHAKLSLMHNWLFEVGNAQKLVPNKFYPDTQGWHYLSLGKKIDSIWLRVDTTIAWLNLEKDQKCLVQFKHKTYLVRFKTWLVVLCFKRYTTLVSCIRFLRVTRHSSTSATPLGTFPRWKVHHLFKSLNADGFTSLLH